MTLTVNINWQQNQQPAQADFKLPAGVTALIGPSGAGKTSLARLIAGVDTPNTGSISNKGKILYSSAKAINLPPQQRSIGFIMQKPALFPTMSVEKNITIGAKIPSQEIQALIKAADINSLLKRPIHNLSGGEAKRVAIVRAVAAQPKYLIMDEPMTGLDATRRNEILILIEKLSQDGLPILLISHQIDEILAVAKHALLMEAGHITHQSNVDSLLSSSKAHTALGIDTITSIISAESIETEDGLTKAIVGNQHIWLTDKHCPTPLSAKLRIQADDVAIATESVEKTSFQNILQATIHSISEQNGEAIIRCMLPETNDCIISKITIKSLQQLNLAQDQTVFLLIKAVAIKEAEDVSELYSAQKT